VPITQVVRNGAHKRPNTTVSFRGIAAEEIIEV
jgi:hypothetical protein